MGGSGQQSLPNPSRPRDAARSITYVYAVLRRSRRVQRRGRCPRRRAASPAPFADPAARHRRRPRRPRRARQVPDRLGQDARLRRPDRRPHRAADGRAGRARARARRASSPPRSSTSYAASPTLARLAVAAVYGGVGLEQAGPRRPPRPHPGRHARPARGPARTAAPFTLDRIRILVLDEADRMLDMGFRPAGRPDRARRARRDRQTLFFSATLDGEAGGIARALHARSRAPRARPPARRSRGRGRAPLRRGRARATSSTALIAELRAPSATWRSCSCAPSAAPTGWSSASGARGVEAVAMHGDKSQRQRERALARFEAGKVRHAGRDRRRRPRHRRRRHLARHQLRSAGRPRGLRPPRRPHRPRRAQRHRHHPGRARRAAGAEPDGRSPRNRARPRRRPGRPMAQPHSQLHTSSSPARRRRRRSGNPRQHERRRMRGIVEDLEVHRSRRRRRGRILAGAGVARVARVRARGDLQADPVAGGEAVADRP